VEQGIHLAGTALKLVCNAVTNSFSSAVMYCVVGQSPRRTGEPLGPSRLLPHLYSTVADNSSAADCVAERPDKALNVDVDSQRENEPLRYRHSSSRLCSYSNMNVWASETTQDTVPYPCASSI